MWEENQEQNNDATAWTPASGGDEASSEASSTPDIAAPADASFAAGGGSEASMTDAFAHFTDGAGDKSGGEKKEGFFDWWSRKADDLIKGERNANMSGPMGGSLIGAVRRTLGNLMPTNAENEAEMAQGKMPSRIRPPWRW